MNIERLCGAIHASVCERRRVSRPWSVYDTRTTNAAFWHFELLLHFIESASYRFQALWKSSTPAASTNFRPLFGGLRLGMPAPLTRSPETSQKQGEGCRAEARERSVSRAMSRFRSRCGQFQRFEHSHVLSLRSRTFAVAWRPCTIHRRTRSGEDGTVFPAFSPAT